MFFIIIFNRKLLGWSMKPVMSLTNYTKNNIWKKNGRNCLKLENSTPNSLNPSDQWSKIACNANAPGVDMNSRYFPLERNIKEQISADLLNKECSILLVLVFLQFATKLFVGLIGIVENQSIIKYIQLVWWICFLLQLFQNSQIPLRTV